MQQRKLFKLVNLIPVTLLFTAIVVAIWLWRSIQNPSQYPIQHVKITENGHYVPDSVLRHSIITHLHGGFFSLNVAELREGLLENPWIENVSIRRVGPDSLLVEISEAQPLARWNQESVLSLNGNIIHPSQNSIPVGLPEIQAPDEIKDTILPIFTEFNEELSRVNLRLSKLQVTKREAWTAWLSSGLQVSMCRENVEKQFANFVTLYPKLINDHAADVISVNLCYPNGLALSWKK